MLEHTFLHIPGIGRATETALWQKGIRNWSDVSRMTVSSNASLSKKLFENIPRSQRALAERDASYFKRLSELGEAWRLYGAFSNNCVFLDVETTGLSPVFNSLTVVGLFDGTEYRLFVDGQNLNDLPSVLQKFNMVVTFNGAQFDLHFLRAAFSTMELPPIHIDLRWLTGRLGFRGGLKAVESQYGIKRPRSVAAMNGFDATVLWSRYQGGSDSALHQLIEYNTQDVVNLKSIMEQSYARLVKRTAGFVRARRSIRRTRALPTATNVRLSGSSADLSHLNIVTGLADRARALHAGTRIVGIDLTGSEKRASGWALLEGSDATSALVRTDEELISRTLAAKPDLVSIDSPLSLPGGAHSFASWQSSGAPIYRACELALKRMGISVFWCLLPSMRGLTLRGMRLASTLRGVGIPVIESYPGAAQDLLRIPRKGTSLEELRRGLHRAGIDGRFSDEKTSHDEVDAITSALVGLFYAADDHISLGNPTEDYLIIPRSPQINYRKLAMILDRSGLDAVHRPDRTSALQCA